jgi:hypothetical protein
MGFFGMSRQGKDAQAQLNNTAAWQNDQAKTWGTKAADSWTRGQEGQDWATKYWQNRAENPAFDPNKVKRTGQDIVDVDKPLANMWGREAQKQNYWETNVPKAQQVTDALTAGNATKGERLADYQTGQQSTIDQGATDMTGNIVRASGEVTGNLEKTYGDAASGFNTAYGDLTGNVNQTRDQLLKSSGDAYGQMSGNVEGYAKQVEMLKPGGEFATARTARAFAPAMASAEGRMRRGGIDPNGIQAASVMAGLSGQQATAMDDAMAAGTKDYVNAQGNLVGMRNNVVGGKLNNEIGLTTNALNTTTALGREQAGSNRDMTLAQGEETRDQIRSDAAALNNVTARKQDQTLSLAGDTHQEGQGLIDEQGKIVLNNRDMATQDLTTFSGLMKDQNNLDLTGIDLQTGQYKLGLENEQLNTQEQDKGAAALTDISGQNFSNSRGAAGTAGGFAGDAANLYGGIYNREAQNAGWGTKMLTGAGMSLLTGGVSGLGGLNPWKRKGDISGQGLGGGVWGG